MIEIITTYYGLFFSFVALILAVVIAGIFIVPLQFRLSLVKNGLKRLRYLLLVYGAGVIITDIVALYFITQGVFTVLAPDFVIVPPNHRTQSLLFIFGASEVFKAIVGYFMYHLQFTPDQILIHDRSMIAEIKRAKRMKNG